MSSCSPDLPGGKGIYYLLVSTVCLFQTRAQMETIVITGRQAETVLHKAATEILREIGPKFRLDIRDRPGKSWLTNKEAQDYLGLSKPTLARYRASGALPYSKVGSSVYYRLVDVEALLERNLVAKRRR